MHPKLSPPPPPPSSHSYPSLPILTISVIGILTTAVLLLAYYLFITKCCLHSRRHLLLLFRLSPAPHRRRPSHFNHLATILHTHPRGLDPCTISSIPTFRFSAGEVHSASRSVECAVCLAEFREHDLLRLLPNCSHSFHVDCIDTWLQFNPNCPLCRDEITPLPIQQYYLNTIEGSHSSIEVREGNPSEESTDATTTSCTPPRPTKTRRFWKMGSMGDEWIDTMREKDERFVVDQPIRRSLSLDSSNDRQLYVSVQEILRQNPSLFRNGEGSSGGGGGGGGESGGGRIRRSFFSFGWSSRNTASVALSVSQSEL